MPLVNSNVILAQARQRRYGIPSLLAGDLAMIVGGIKAAEAMESPLILAFNQEVTPTIPLEIGMSTAAEAARQADVPVAVILDHGASLEQIVVAIRHGASSVMFDGSYLPYEENLRLTQQAVKLAHAAGVDVEAELGGVGGSAVEIGHAGGHEVSFTDPEQATEFVARTGVDVLAISFGNTHGVYQGEPQLDLARVQTIHERIQIPLAMHGASGLDDDQYALVIASGISKICYYTAMSRVASQTILAELKAADPETLLYHQIISQATDFFTTATQDLLALLGCAGKASTGK
ncbi:MAG: class II fructose-bisphosphate aldolase [Chloroflexi bacterium]|nr:class II fructose-bisphosphate aldolase [Chloroflexota bacterium]